jgi:hypothetical protein
MHGKNGHLASYKNDALSVKMWALENENFVSFDKIKIIVDLLSP